MLKMSRFLDPTVQVKVISKYLLSGWSRTGVLKVTTCLSLLMLVTPPKMITRAPKTRRGLMAFHCLSSTSWRVGRGPLVTIAAIVPGLAANSLPPGGSTPNCQYKCRFSIAIGHYVDKLTGSCELKRLTWSQLHQLEPTECNAVFVHPASPVTVWTGPAPPVPEPWTP